MNGWLRPSDAAKYCGVSPRTIRDWMKVEGLEYSKIRGIVVIKVEDLDNFLKRNVVTNTIDQDIDRIVNDVLR